MLKVIELFAGIGSQTQALKNIGIEHEVIAISDIDKYADKSYRVLHDPNVINLGDIRTIESLPQADLWTYSFPCQDISVAGLQKGFEQGSGTRSGLLWEVERLLLKAKEQGTLPKYLLLENVKNLIGTRFKSNYDEWLLFLSSLGYETYTKVLNAKYFGVPQNRERVFGVSILGNSVPYVFPENRELKVRLKDVLEDKVDERYYLKESTIMSILNTTFNQRKGLLHGEQDICATLCARDFREPKCVAVGKLEGGVWDKRYNQIRQVFHPDGISPTIMAGGGGGTETKIVAIRGREQGQVLEENNQETTNALTTVQKDNMVMEKPNKLVCRGYKKFTDKNGYVPELFNPYHAKEIKDIAPTQTTKCGIDTGTATVLKAETYCLNRYRDDGKERSVQDRIYDARGVGVAVTPSFRGNIQEQVNTIRIRKLTPTECWRLMGWNDTQIQKIIKSGISNTQMYKQAGNGIVVPVLEAIFTQLFMPKK